MAERQFPIQGVGLIPWSLAAKAYEDYSRHHDQSLERIAERGGFGLAELGFHLSQPRGRLTDAQEINLCCEVAAREILKAIRAAPPREGE